MIVVILHVTRVNFMLCCMSIKIFNEDKNKSFFPDKTLESPVQGMSKDVLQG